MYEYLADLRQENYKCSMCQKSGILVDLHLHLHNLTLRHEQQKNDTISAAFVTGYDIGVRISARSSVCPSVRLSTIYVESSIEVHFSEAVIARNVKPCVIIVLAILFKHAL